MPMLLQSELFASWLDKLVKVAWVSCWWLLFWDPAKSHTSRQAIKGIEWPPDVVSRCWLTVTRHGSNTAKIEGGCKGNTCWDDEDCVVWKGWFSRIWGCWECFPPISLSYICQIWKTYRKPRKTAGDLMVISNIQIKPFWELFSWFVQVLVRVGITIQHRGVRGIEISWVCNALSGRQDLLHWAPVTSVTMQFIRCFADTGLGKERRAIKYHLSPSQWTVLTLSSNLGAQLPSEVLAWGL